MSNLTVNDIIGKGFKFEQTAQLIPEPAASGTIAMVVGTSGWGPIGVPSFIAAGQADFETKFGSISETDDGGEALKYHLKHSQRAYFTRVAITNPVYNPSNPSQLLSDIKIAKKASKEVSSPSLEAIIYSNELDAAVKIKSIKSNNGGINNKFSFSAYNTQTPGISDVLDVALPSSISAPAKISNEIQTGVKIRITSGNLTNRSLEFVLDGKKFKLNYKGTNILSNVTAANLVDLINAGSAGINPATAGDDAVNSSFVFTGKDLGATADWFWEKTEGYTLPGGDWDATLGLVAAFNPFIVSGNFIEFESVDQGSDSQVQIVKCDFRIGSGVNSIYLFEKDDFPITGVNTSLEIIKNSLNQATQTATLLDDIEWAVIKTRSNKRKLVLKHKYAGDESFVAIKVTAINSANTILGFSNTALTSANLKSPYGVGGLHVINFATANYSVVDQGAEGDVAGIFEAKYEGHDGNQIQIITEYTQEDGQFIKFYFKNRIIGSINYDPDNLEVYNPESSEYIEKIIAEDTNISSVLSFKHNYDSTKSLDDQPRFSKETNRTYILSGGSSGGAIISEKGNTATSIDAASQELKDIAINAILNYSNVDLFNIDVFACPLMSEIEEGGNSLIELAEKRQDCLGIIDPPYFATTNVATAINRVKQWHNGQGGFGRTTQLNSWRVATYFPWLIIKKSNGVVNPAPPSTRVLGTFAKVDSLRKTTYTTPAGIIAGLEDVEHLQFLLDQDQRNQLYADVYNTNINPIAFSISDGFFIDGQKTTQRKITGKRSPLDRISVARTSLYIKKEIQRNVKFFFYTPTDPRSWDAFKKMIEGILGQLAADRVIEDGYIVISDKSINTKEITNQNGMVAIAEWSPINLTEKIKVRSSIVDKTVTVTQI